MKILVVILFVIQLTMQIALTAGWMEYKTTTPMYEDLITTIIMCTTIIVFAIHEVKG